jgi:uncharacterized protein YecT (DUF1311 family)
MKRLFFLLLSLVVIHFAALGADADSEPKLTLPQAKAKFDKADKGLNDAWAAAKKALSDADFAQLREEQREWVEWRGRMASAMSAKPADDDGSKSPDYLDAEAYLSADRARWLSALAVQTKEPSDTMTGHWIDSWGGEVNIVEKDGQIYFVFMVVRGHGLNIGQIAGIARWHSTIGWFSDKGRDKNKTDEANIAFVLHSPKLEVTEAGADYYHGNSALFNGEYVKVKPLDGKEEEETLKAGKTGEVPGN